MKSLRSCVVAVVIFLVSFGDQLIQKAIDFTRV